MGTSGEHATLRLLWIDDEPLMRRAIQLAAPDTGAEVETADGAEAARAQLAKSRFDWVICDYRLREGTAQGFLRELLQRGQRVVVLTGDRDAVDPGLAVRVIEKPVIFRDLLAELAAD